MSDDETRDPLVVLSSQRVGPLLEMGQVSLASRIASDAIARDPSDPSAHVSMSFVMSHTKRFDAALTAAQEALRLDPDHRGAQVAASLAYHGLGRWAEAERAIRAVLAVEPDNDGAIALYARLLWRLDRDRAALAWVEHALSLDPADAEHHALRAQLMLGLPSSSWTASADSARAALRIDPHNDAAQGVLGFVEMREGNRAAAEAHFRAVLSRDPNDALALRGLAELTMASVPIYAPMLWLSLALQRLSPEGRLGFVFGAWALYRGASAALSAGGLPGVAEVLFWVYLGFCVWTWTAESVTRALLSSRHPWLRGA